MATTPPSTLGIFATIAILAGAGFGVMQALLFGTRWEGAVAGGAVFGLLLAIGFTPFMRHVRITLPVRDREEFAQRLAAVMTGAGYVMHASREGAWEFLPRGTTPGSPGGIAFSRGGMHAVTVVCDDQAATIAGPNHAVRRLRRALA